MGASDVRQMPRGLRAPRGATALRREKALKGANPMGVTGMKQARSALGTVRREKGERP